VRRHPVTPPEVTPLSVLSSARAGDYTKIRQRWNLADEAVTTPEVNPPGLPIDGK